MTRHVFAIEGPPTILPQTRLKPGSLWVSGDRIFVTWNFDWQNEPIGYATDLQRDEATGEVSMEVVLTPEGELIVNNKKADEPELYSYSFFADQLEEEWVEATDEDEGYRLITKARIRGLSLIPKAANP
jgi:hypothetical protein